MPLGQIELIDWGLLLLDLFQSLAYSASNYPFLTLYAGVHCTLHFKWIKR